MLLSALLFFFNANVAQNLSNKELKALEKLSKNNKLVVQEAHKGHGLSS